MYKDIEIKNFKCFKDLKIKDLKRFNLIAGKNGSGKTALLEAIFLHARAYNPEVVFRINSMRQIDVFTAKSGDLSETPYDGFFKDFNSREKIIINGSFTPSGKRELSLKVFHDREDFAALTTPITVEQTAPSRIMSADRGVHVLELEYKENRNKRGIHRFLITTAGGIQRDPTIPPPPFPCYFISTRIPMSAQDLAERFGKIEMEKRKAEIVSVLQLIEPRIQDLTMIIIGGQPILHADLGMGRLLPLTLAGGGIVPIAEGMVALSLAENGVILFDEVENGLHHGILNKLWTAIGEAARRNNTQVFATTHSWECIQAAHRSFSKKKPYDFRLHRLDQIRGDVTAVTYDQETLGASFEINLEVR